MNPTVQREKALAFRKLHQSGSVLVLPNAWDCLSATLLAQAGFPALATTSAGIASIFGYPDGQRIPKLLMLGMASRIASVVSIPVTADLEAGYGTTPEQVADSITTALRMGLVGANLEDSRADQGRPLRELELQVDILKAARQAVDAKSIPMFINARTDVFLRSTSDDRTRVAEVVRRAGAYHQAGADGIFVIGVKDANLIGELVRQIVAPVNILWTPGAPSISELQDLGVARVTFGSGLTRGILPFLRDMAQQLRQSSTSRALNQTEFSNDGINDLFRDKVDLVGTSYFDELKVLDMPEATANFTPRAQQVLALARREADRRHDNFVGTEHLLLGIVALGQGVATNVLLKEGLALEKLREAVEEALGPPQNQQVLGNMPYTPRLKKVLTLAAKEAKALTHTYVGTEHLLLALLREEEGVVAKILQGLGIRIEAIRHDILKELDPNA